MRVLAFVLPGAHSPARLLVFFLLLLVIAPGTGTREVSSASPGQTAPPQDASSVTFRAEVNYVEVDARVVDIKGAFIRDLGRGDFEIFEDGVRQTIDSFALVDLPIEPHEPPGADGLAVSPDVVSNAQSVDGRLYVLVLDDLHTPILDANFAKDTARRFVEKLGANDRATVITTGGTSAMTQPFTNDRRLLIQAIDRFVGGSDAVRPPLQALRTLESAAEFLAGLRGRRKTLIYVSEGIPMALRDFQIDSRLAIAAATRNNVSIYAIDPRGAIIAGADSAFEPARVESAADVAKRQAAGILKPPPPPGVSAAQRAVREAHINLRILTEETGGFAVLDTNGLDAGLDRIVRESSSYYLFGYYSLNDRREGRTRRIEVRTRRPRVQVLARSSYIEPRRSGPAARTATAPAVGVSAQLADAMTAPLSLNGLRLSTTAAAFKNTASSVSDASVAVVVEVGANGLPLKKDSNAFTGVLEMSVSAFDTSGFLVRGERLNLNLALTPETFSQVRESGFRVLSRIDLPPGRYQIRVGGRVPDSGAIGTLFYDLEVPNFSEAPLAMSHLLFTSTAATRTPTPQSDARLMTMLPSPPTSEREFSDSDELTVFAELYDSVGRLQSVEITTTVLTEDGQMAFMSGESRSAADIQAAAGRYPYRVDIPLWTLGPGSYVLKVEAQSGRDQTKVINRRVPFRIRK